MKRDYYMTALGELIECEERKKGYHLSARGRRVVTMLFDRNTEPDLVLVVDKRIFDIATLNDTESAVEIRISRKNV